MKINSATVLKYAKHLLIIAALGAASIILGTILGDLKLIDPTKLSPQLQGVVALILPTLIIAGSRLKAEVDAEEAAAENAKLVSKNIALAAENSSLKAKVAAATAAAAAPAATEAPAQA